MHDQQLRNFYLQQMGIDVWVERQINPCNDEKLKKLAREVAACKRCTLHKTRSRTVFARGNPNSNLMIIGEAPGYYEDKQGMPFVGKAGQLLNKMLKTIGLMEEDVYIANVLKCRPPDNRDPKREELDACTGFLREQIKLIDPKLILAVGRFAGSCLIGKTLPLNAMRNKIHQYQQKPVLVSYHPAYLLRNPADKKKAYQDLLAVRQFLSGLSFKNKDYWT
ncbi:uracil-DNA glycosylase [Legionella londiniensis]|uniref:Type-4 uracil-DNA glycosylase n=1 Tax=Legionella londiniensis TaxID=45068 RepID=A0A0W0VRS5_9GAMM|nr:uracil-DNA glycosylase [Legionella londiniensis]KTD22342.1 bacteriophage-like DNA polymerase [Legionella londiniensis]STX93084.1 bacteriophage-type DNA polymerase [Legionella londiniensis]